MKKLYYIRHGLSEMNRQGLVAGRIESPLSKEGRVQVKATSKQTKKLKIDYIVCSPQGRAIETAQIIAKEIGYPADKIHINSLFMERHFGKAEGQVWSPDFDIDGFADVETKDTLLKRAKQALRFLESLPSDNILVVGHGAFGRALRHHVLEDFPFDNVFDSVNKIANAEIIQWL